jgi:Ca2+-transporting ATPase
MAAESIVITAGALAAFGYGVARHGSRSVGATLAFNTLTAAQLLHSVSCRSPEPVLLGAKPLPRNPKLELALGASFVIQVLANLVPSLRRLLGLAPMGLGDIFVTAAGALLPLVINESMKGACAHAPGGVSDHRESLP